MRYSRANRARAALTVALLAAAACTDRTITEPRTRPPGDGGEGAPATTIAALTCTASVADKSVSCVPAEPSTGAAGGLIIGRQGVYVQLTSSNLAYNSGTGQFTFDATLQNLIEQPLGTTDGTTQDPGGISIFFATGPTVVQGTGSAAVLPDGFGTFTEAAQPYYAYPYLLDQGEVSPAETWTFIVPPTATRFVFTVLVSAPVQFPTGYITLDGRLPGRSYGSLHPSTPEELTAVIKDAYGNVLPGTVAFGTSDPACASVTGTGTVTGVRAGTCTVTVTGGGVSGSLSFDVTGTVRAWNGSVSSDWSVGGNWDGGFSPAAVDSVLVPDGTPNDPALVANTGIGGVEVADGAVLALGAFTLAASANVATGLTPGSGITAAGGVLELAGATGTVRGRVPSLRVTGDYALDGELQTVAPGRVLGGRIRNAGFLLRGVNQ
jgi:Bacterial Ig-like domain (group 2)